MQLIVNCLNVINNTTIHTTHNYFFFRKCSINTISSAFKIGRSYTRQHLHVLLSTHLPSTDNQLEISTTVVDGVACRMNYHLIKIFLFQLNSNYISYPSLYIRSSIYTTLHWTNIAPIKCQKYQNKLADVH